MSLLPHIADLSSLVETLDRDLGVVSAAPDGESARIIRVTNDGEIAVRSLDGKHPFEALLGFVAPDDWDVLGVIAPGWGTHFVGPRVGERCRVRVIHVMSRAGDEASLMRFAGDTESTQVGEKPTGRIADCIRRAFDLPTQDESDESLTAYWANRAFDALAQPVTVRHDATAAARILEATKPASTWEAERWATCERGSELMDGAVACWMDAGMFARYVLSEISDAATVMPVAKANCTADAWRFILATVTQALS